MAWSVIRGMLEEDGARRNHDLHAKDSEVVGVTVAIVAFAQLSAEEPPSALS